MTKALAKSEKEPIQSKAVNPYEMASAAAKLEGPGTAVAQQDSQRAMIEVMTAFEVAKRFPRDMINVANKILKECERPTLANLATYSYPRGGQEITGPTIRLLEAIARAHGNIRFGWEVLESTKQKSSIRAFAIDLENNTLRDTRFDVRHWRDTKQGGYQLSDERDIYELQANMAMRRVRGCLQSLIAGDIIEMALQRCEETSQESVDTSPKGQQKMLDAFKEFGVNQKMIEAKCGGLKFEAFRAPQMLVLQRIYSGLKDGLGHVEDIFDMSLASKSAKKAGGPDLKEKITDGAHDKNKEKQKDKPKKEEPAPKDTHVENEAGKNDVADKSEEDHGDGQNVSHETKPAEGKTMIEEIIEDCQKAKDGQELYEVWENWGANIGAIKRNNPDGYKEIMAAKTEAEKRIAGNEA